MSHYSFIRLAAIALTVVTGMEAQAQGIVSVAGHQQTTLKSERTATLSLRSVTLKQALTEISRQTGVVVRMGDDVLRSKTRINLEVVDASAREAAQAAVRGTSFAVQSSAVGGLLVTAARSSESPRVQGIISGKVTDSKSGKPVAGASVTAGEGRSAVTGEDGSFRIAGVPAGSHLVSVRLVGYARQTRSVTVGDDATIISDFKLDPTANVLEQVIVTGTVVQTELKAVPSAITVVTAQQIEERGITRIDQLFRGDVPGLFSSNQGSISSSDAVVMFSRGATLLTNNANIAASNSIKTYIDGVEMSDPQYLSHIDPKSIERIEILTGPQASTIYGSNAINGVMQVFTKRGLSQKPQLTATFLSGTIQNSFSSSIVPQHDYSAQLNGAEGRFSYNTGGSWVYMGAWTPSKQTSRYGGFGGVRAALGKVTADITARSTMTRTRQWGANTQTDVELVEAGLMAPVTANGRIGPSNVTIGGRTIGGTVSFAPVSWWTHEIGVGQDLIDYDFLRTAPQFTQSNGADTGLFVQLRDRSSNSARYATTLQLPLTSLARASITLGGDRIRTTNISTVASPVALTGTLTNISSLTRTLSKNSGGFLQSQLSFNDAVFLIYGLRAEWNPNYGEDAQPNLAPRYGIAYTREIGPVTTKLRASYGKSTRPPTETQRLAELQDNATLIGLYGLYETNYANPELQPEYQQGGEGGVELYFGALGSLVVTRYNQTVDNLIAQPRVDSIRSLVPNTSGNYTYTGITQYLNLGSLRNQGWELQGSLNTGPFTTRGTYSWTKSRVIGFLPEYASKISSSASYQYQKGSTFNFLPEHTWALGFSYARGASRVLLNVNGTGSAFRSFADEVWLEVNRRRFDTMKPRLNLPGSYRATSPHYVMADLNASQRFSNLIEGILQVQNLGDYYRADNSAQYVVMGRQTKIGLRIRM